MVVDTREGFAPAFEPVDPGSLGQDPIEPKRGRRSLSQTPAAIRARAARAAGKGKADAKPRRKPTARRSGPKSLAPEISAFLTLVNGILIVSPLGTRPVEAIADPSVVPSRIGDELDAVEIGALASSIDAQCKRSPRVRKYVEAVLGAGSGGTLITVLALIAARRAARHGLLPENVDYMGGMILSADIDSLAAMTPVADAEPIQDPQTGETAPDRDAEPTPIDFDRIG